jgi:hypothetical protein
MRAMDGQLLPSSEKISPGGLSLAIKLSDGMTDTFDPAKRCAFSRSSKLRDLTRIAQQIAQRLARVAEIEEGPVPEGYAALGGMGDAMDYNPICLITYDLLGCDASRPRSSH